MTFVRSCTARAGRGGGTIAATPTVTNAVLDALAPPGVSDVPMPAARERIWRAIHESARS